MRWLVPTLVTAALLLTGCGDSHSTDDRPDGGGGEDGGAFDGGGLPDGGSGGECASADDCGGEPCLELTPGGHRVCAQPIVEEDGCDEPTLDECCTTADCAEGICVQGPVGGGFCGGPVPVGYNVCATDQCQDDGDCGDGQVCIPAGAFGRPVRTCMTAFCRTDADCTAQAGGSCEPVPSSCCPDTLSLACVYPSDGCRSDDDCSGTDFCQVTEDRAQCVEGPVICPV